MQEKYKHWDILETMPEGWAVDKSCGSPYKNTVFITNGKSVLNGQKRALLKVSFTPKVKEIQETKAVFQKIQAPPHEQPKQESPYPANAVNILARSKFKEHLMKEIMFDLMVCEIEGWDKGEYLKELRVLINGIRKPIKSKKNTQNLLTLF